MVKTPLYGPAVQRNKHSWQAESTSVQLNSKVKKDNNGSSANQKQLTEKLHRTGSCSTVGIEPQEQTYKAQRPDDDEEDDEDMTTTTTTTTTMISMTMMIAAP